MRESKLLMAAVAAFATVASFSHVAATETPAVASGRVKHVLLLSIDGMHAVDFYNCSHGISGANGGSPYCPNLSDLSHRAINYVAAVSSKPSDSFPGLAALVTGGSPKSTGLYYDVAYDRSLDPPATTTGTGLAGGSCAPYGLPSGTTTDYDQGIDLDDTQLNGGAPGPPQPREESPPSTRRNWYEIRSRDVPRSIRGISFGRIPSSASYTRPVATRPGSTSTRPIPWRQDPAARD